MGDKAKAVQGSTGDPGLVRVKVGVVEARALASKDRNGSSDPYCVISIGKQRFKTKVVKECLAPRWGEEFTFQDVATPGVLNVCLWDYDRLRKDDFLGQLDIPVDKMGESQQWYTLEGRGRDEVISGDIFLTILVESYSELQRRYSVQRL